MKIGPRKPPRQVLTPEAKKRRDQTLKDLSRPIMLHLCRDGTVTYRRPGQRVFNGVALPFFSVHTEQQARDLQARFCRVIPAQHPEMEPGATWYKISIMPDGTDLALRTDPSIRISEMADVTVMFRKYFNEHLVQAP